MNWFRTMIAMFLLALWVPMASHELLELCGWIHVAATTDSGEAHDDDHDAADGVCQVASTHIQVPQPPLSGELLPGLIDFSGSLSVLCEAALALPNGPDPPGAAPPELSQTWQFSFRASLAARAPSLIS